MFSRKNKKNTINLSSAEFAHRTVNDILLTKCKGHLTSGEKIQWNICVKFHENISKIFEVAEQTQVHDRNHYLQCSKGHNSKSRKNRATVLVLTEAILLRMHNGSVSGEVIFIWKHSSLTIKSSSKKAM